MKFILKALIILMITLSSSACFDNLYQLHINGVVAPTVDGDEIKCTPDDAFEIEGAKTYHTQGLMDLAYTKISGVKSGLYGYYLKLNVFNLLTKDAKDNTNLAHIRKANIKVFNYLNNIIDKETITVDFTVGAETAAVIPVRILSNKAAWHGGAPIDMTRDFLHVGLYNQDLADQDLDNPNAGLLTPYIMVEVTVEGETLGGVNLLSDVFKFRINLCVNCLICPDNNINCQNDRSYNPGLSPDDMGYYCPGADSYGYLCSMSQDYPIQCTMPDEN